MRDALSRREGNYQKWLGEAKKENCPAILLELAAALDDLGDYHNSKSIAEHCRKRAAEEQGKIDAENDRQRIIAEQKRKAQQKRIETITIISAMTVLLVLAITLLVSKVIIPWIDYRSAVTLIENGQYEEAIAAFEMLGDYKDAKEQTNTLARFAFRVSKSADLLLSSAYAL